MVYSCRKTPGHSPATDRDHSGAFKELKLEIPIISELDKQVVILSLGRLASAIGTGLTIFYAPIFFVNVAGISATSVGIGIGCGGFFGILGRFAGGSLADSRQVGRRGGLLIASFFLALGAAFFAATEHFWQFLLGNIFTGIGIGFYWPAAESFISDITRPDKLNEAFALTRMADYLGLGLGVITGGLIIGFHSAYRVLFILDALSYLLLFGFVLRGIKETLPEKQNKKSGILANWKGAFTDPKLVLFALLNLLFTNNILQMSSTLPLYFSNIIPFEGGSGFKPGIVSTIFSLYIVMLSLFVMPIARLMSTKKKTRVLIKACLFWTLAQGVIAYIGTGSPMPVIVSILAVTLVAVANSLYGPASSSLVVEISPKDSRATYLAINSLCWGISGSFGPAVGLAVLDWGSEAAVAYWVVLAVINTMAIAGLYMLERI